ncbi:DEAD-box ATP dependent DNA helicase [Oceanimonas sp. GK1]|uniref:DEAD/DEAH box helicase n=1 Tax=Oceanimonas sp. (strain GK1 / IBRC-M 10197) TaxID=511062 RepID=UPI0002495011|nr:DEAD/DEAH box helicase [Oceanimonas sp. GK1]AEY01297.1 DEAD-box ATP dependent DNA helicase [Oceanimonas sp. GK1]
MAQNNDTFRDFGLDTRLVRALDHQGLNTPTDIQLKAIPVVMAGFDLLASSKTGSGKTLAYLLPALQRLMKTRALSKRDPRALILAPTRELARQVYAQLRSLAGNSVNIALLLGGENFNDQLKSLRRQPDVIVATPGRLANHLDARSLMLNGLELLILDEADRMLDLGFAPQLERINQAADHRRRQTLMFSATLDHAETNAMAATLLTSPKRVAVGEAHAEHQDIEQRFVLGDHLDHKQALLEHLLASEPYQQAIIFTATRADTERLASHLQQTELTTAALHGDLSQAERNRIMDAFARGQHKLLITTDVASRGLDLLQVSLVINFDMPKQAEEYVHRIGRTGRAGASGTAVSLVGPRDWDAFKRVERFLQRTLSFTAIEGLQGKFKGLRPPARKHGFKGKPGAAGGKDLPNGKKPARPTPKRPGPKRPEGFTGQGQDTAGGATDGMAPLKRKKPRPEPES